LLAWPTRLESSVRNWLFVSEQGLRRRWKRGTWEEEKGFRTATSVRMVAVGLPYEDLNSRLLCKIMYASTKEKQKSLFLLYLM
jgi:hypothetical protein